jgi:hypothetical protein
MPAFYAHHPLSKSRKKGMLSDHWDAFASCQEYPRGLTLGPRGAQTMARQAVISVLVPDPNYVWWIDELMRSPLPTGGVIAHRLYEYGPFDTADAAEKMIEQLKLQPRFRQSDLRASREKRQR